MKDVKELINSGILEAYLLGLTNAQETLEIKKMAEVSPDIQEAINRISANIEEIAMSNAVAPDPIIRPMLMATIDYIERMQNGEQSTFPPILHEGSRTADYNEWLHKDGMVLPGDFNDVYARIIGYTPEVMTAIVWIKEVAPQEMHDNEYERFLIVEGTCNITIGDEVHKLVEGDFLQIPLHKKHHVQVTSNIPCKVILQRVAA